MGAFKGPREWGRLLTAMITPFREDGSVDLDQVAAIADYLVVQQKNDGIVVNGTTGESPTLSEHEKLAILEVTLQAVGDRASVVFGAGTYNTAESVELAREGERRGAHGIMVVNPYYNKPGQAGLFAHFKEVAGAIGLPMMIYNIQPRSSINLETSTLMRLAEIENIVAVKEASGNIGQISDVCAQAPEGFRVYSGDDGLTLPILSVGGHGVVSVAAHVVGPEIKEMVDVFRVDPDRARALHHQVMPTIRALFSAPSPVPVKYAMSRKGLCHPRVRLPLVELSEAERAVVDQVL